MRVAPALAVLLLALTACAGDPTQAHITRQQEQIATLENTLKDVRRQHRGMGESLRQLESELAALNLQTSLIATKASPHRAVEANLDVISTPPEPQADVAPLTEQDLEVTPKSEPLLLQPTPVSGYVVQIAALKDPQAVESYWRNFKSTHPELTRGKTPYTSVFSDTSGTNWTRLHLGTYATQAQAQSTCQKLASTARWCAISPSEDKNLLTGRK